MKFVGLIFLVGSAAPHWITGQIGPTPTRRDRMLAAALTAGSYNRGNVMTRTPKKPAPSVPEKKPEPEPESQLKSQGPEFVNIWLGESESNPLFKLSEAAKEFETSATTVVKELMAKNTELAKKILTLEQSKQILLQKIAYDCTAASVSAYFFSTDCNQGTTGADNIIGLYEAGARFPHAYRKTNSVIANKDFSKGYSSNTGQSLSVVTDDSPVGYEWATTFDYCLGSQDPNTDWDQPNNGWLNWFGFDTYPATLNGKEITISFNFKWNSETPPTTNAHGDQLGLKVAGVFYNNWFGENNSCVDAWCEFKETLTLTSTADEQKIIFFFNQVAGTKNYGCFFRFNNFKIEW